MKLTNKILVPLATIVLIAAVFAIYFAAIRHRDEANDADARSNNSKTGAGKNSVNIGAQTGSSQNDFRLFIAQKMRLAVKEPEVSIIFTGDVMLSRDVVGRIHAKKDPNYPFREIAGYLKTADAVFANLESPITPGLPVKKKELKLRADPGVEKALSSAGFTVLSLANNHMFDFGRKGFADTTTLLKQAGIVSTGAGQNEQAANEPAYLDRQGIRFAFLAYADEGLSLPKNVALQNSAGTAAMNTDSMVKAVKNAKKRSDFVIVSMHAGDEYLEAPNRKQVEFAHAAIDAGADIVIGHHPHVVQKAERYKEKYIFYSLGNFVFDQMWSEATREGIAVKAYFTKKAIKKFEFQPVLIKDFAQPNPIDSISARSNGNHTDAAGQNDAVGHSDNRKHADRIMSRLQISPQKPLNGQVALRWNREHKNYELENIDDELLGVMSDKTKLPEFRINKSLVADLDNDKQQERYSLNNGRLTVVQGSKLIWKSKDTWWVDDFALVDSTGDGRVDLNISVWKSGSYGSSKPFWIKENDRSIKNHFFVFKFDGISVKPVWQSSNLDKPNREFAFSDLDCDGTQELIAIEGEYDGNKTKKTNTSTKINANTKFKNKLLQKRNPEKRWLAVWKWNGWGFSCEWQSAPAAYSNIHIMEINGIKNIFADKRNVSSSMK